MEQNIFDNETFFRGYCELRDTDTNCNLLMEQPEMAKLLPDVNGKVVLDLGCGFGHNCAEFSDNGASRVVGVDISKKMLSVARAENSRQNIEYLNISMTEISGLQGKFDLVYSSLAFHYIEDFKALMLEISALLNEGGTLLFSQEHPICTASKDNSRYYTFDEEGRKNGLHFSHYLVSGKREDEWFVKGRVHYHRTFSDIANAIADAGLCIEHISEPIPDGNMIRLRPKSDTQHKPLFLIIKAKKL